MSESTQHKLSRNRAPRVHITYDVETGGAQQRKEIPFVVGVMAPLGGKSDKPAKSLRGRKFVNIDRDNFDKVLASIEPRAIFSVPDVQAGNGASLAVDLKFNSFSDYAPVAVLLQVEKVAEVFHERARLRDFLAKLDGNDELGDICEAIIGDKSRSKAITAVFASAADAISEARTLSDSVARDEAILAAIATADREPGSDIGDMLTKGRMVLEPGQVPYALELIEEFVNQVVGEYKATEDGQINLAALLVQRISQKDGVISRQLNYILHHPEFQALEASWRGLHYLVLNSETGSGLKIRVLNASFDELYKDLDKAVEYDQSTLFKLIYEDEYGTFGGEPYGLLVGDYELGRSAKDIIFAEKISNLAAAAHAPFISSAYAKLFDIEDFDSLHRPRDLNKVFESAELVKWRAFRETEDSRYLTLTLPKVLLRLPYHNQNNPVDAIYFDEDVAVSLYKTDENGYRLLDNSGNPIVQTREDDNGVVVEKTIKAVDSKKMLWGNPAYILARVITKSFSRYGWTAAIRGVEGGGLVEGLPAYTYETEEGDITLNCPTQVAITDRREKELNDLGFMSLCHCKGSDKAAFFGGQTTNKARQYLTDAANKNAQVSAMLPYMLTASRFTHYIKVMMRERVGTFMSAQNVSDYLNGWITQYVLLDDTATSAMKARYPLREARIDVTDVEGRVGAYKATVFLRPHFQLEELTASIRLVADLPA